MLLNMLSRGTLQVHEAASHLLLEGTSVKAKSFYDFQKALLKIPRSWQFELSAPQALIPHRVPGFESWLLHTVVHLQASKGVP